MQATMERHAVTEEIMRRKYRIRDYDFKLVLMVLCLSAIGVMTIGSAEESLRSRQLAGVAAGAIYI